LESKGRLKVNKTVTVDGYREVCTDEQTNILRMCELYKLPGKWKDDQAVVSYRWLHRTDESPRLIPLTISTPARYGKKEYWCRGQFMDYRVFTSKGEKGSELSPPAFNWQIRNRLCCPANASA
jgi:hypothetical protein